MTNITSFCCLIGDNTLSVQDWYSSESSLSNSFTVNCLFYNFRFTKVVGGSLLLGLGKADESVVVQQLRLQRSNKSLTNI